MRGSGAGAALAAGLVLKCLAPAWADDVDAVIECMRANVPEAVRIQEVELASHDRQGPTRTLRGRFYGLREDGLVRFTLRLTAPSDMAGSAYLLREASGRSDEMYIFLPALNRVRRVGGGSGDNSLFGTDFSYADVKQAQGAFDGGDVRLLGSGEYAGRAVYRLESTPANTEESTYTRIAADVDRHTCITLRAEFFEGDSLRKVLTVVPESLQQLEGGHWYAAQSEMQDKVTGTGTRLKVLGVEITDKLPSRLFNPRLFYLGS